MFNPDDALIQTALANPGRVGTPRSRRQFLSMMLASAGGAVLTACGGGGGGGSDATAANSAKSTTSDGSTASAAAGGTTTAAAGTTTQTNSQTASQTASQTGSQNNANTNTNTNTQTNTQQNTQQNAQTATSASSALFYGINGHMAYNTGIYKTMSPAAQLAMLQDLGVTNYRCDIAGAGMAQVLADALKGPFAGSGVAILPVLNAVSAGWSSSSSESAAYTLGFNLGVNCARPLKGLVTHIECGNELDVPIKIGGDGSSTADWSPSGWPAFRGVTRGMIDGVKSIDPSIKCGVNVGIPMAYRALQMLWNGISPDGSAQGVTDSAIIHWDFTSYHWYKSSGNVQCGGRYNACVDVLQVLKDSFNVPIWLTEWGWNGSGDTQQSAADYVTKALTQYKSVKDKYNIETIMMYAMIDDNYGLVQMDGTTKNQAYAVFKNFVAANPV